MWRIIEILPIAFSVIFFLDKSQVVMFSIGDLPTVINWFDVGYDELRVSLFSVGTLNRCERHQWFYSESRKIVTQ